MWWFLPYIHMNQPWIYMCSPFWPSLPPDPIPQGHSSAPGPSACLILGLITLQDCSGICHTLTWISHGYTCVSHPQPSSHLPPHPIPQGCPSAPAFKALFHTSNLDWQSISHKVIYMFQCYSLKSSHPCLLPQSPGVCSLYLCLFCCLAYRVIITIFLHSIYMH